MGTWYAAISQPLLKGQEKARIETNHTLLLMNENLHKITIIDFEFYVHFVVQFKHLQNVCPEDLIQSKTDLSWSWITDENTGGYLE